MMYFLFYKQESDEYFMLVSSSMISKQDLMNLVELIIIIEKKQKKSKLQRNIDACETYERMLYSLPPTWDLIEINKILKWLFGWSESN